MCEGGISCLWAGKPRLLTGVHHVGVQTEKERDIERDREDILCGRHSWHQFWNRPPLILCTHLNKGRRAQGRSL